MTERNLELEKNPLQYVEKIEFYEDGPWKELPHFIRFEYKGYKCYMSKGPMLNWCGYVILPKDHKFYEKYYDEVDVSVHGGITYSDYEDPDDKEKGWTIGFDCAHAWDKIAKPKAMRDIYYKMDKLYPTLREEIYRDKDYVEQEIKDLVNQL